MTHNFITSALSLFFIITPLIHSSQRFESVETKEPLEQQSQDEQPNDTEKLCEAARIGDLANVKYYIETCNMPVNSQNKNDLPPLMYALGDKEYDTDAVVQYLIEQGALSQFKVPSQWPAWVHPLAYAVETEKLSACQMLLKANADPMTPGRCGKTVVERARKKLWLCNRKLNPHTGQSEHLSDQEWEQQEQNRKEIYKLLKISADNSI